MEIEDLRKRQSELVSRLSHNLPPQEMAEASREFEEVTRLLEERQ